jgi:hypothetical protein
VPEVTVEGDPVAPLEEALVVGDVDDVDALRAAFAQGRPVVVRASSPQSVKAALARPEVACVIVPANRPDLLELDLTELTYG